ncbi:vitamin K epoxide reductase family protein [Nocardioides sp. AE5]|uniref:vitamin K epoxide reductase family protein n=1 Tax=Nocardioides sp. AE5 TaxID=2962573 RepID=UPI002881B931|nr:vitamin K epoxide reductase family protein [Nocardioides sp. AE5]MDT0201638.1 vitamin K epoxide reductase family protein [Nocardioides sp. AE5]
MTDGPPGRDEQADDPIHDRADADPAPGSEHLASQWGRLTGLGLAVLSALGLTASLTLSIDKVRLLQDPSYVPSCNFNPLLSCGSVMDTDQAAVFGFPNPFLGLIGFAIMLTVAVLVVAGSRLPKPIVIGGAVGSLTGAGFVHWLIFQSIYRIEALCPWCMVVWAVTIPLALWFTLAALDRVGGAAVRRVVDVVHQWRVTVLAAWYLAVAALILVRFWDYWSTVLA